MLAVTALFLTRRRQHTRCALVTGVQTCALPIFGFDCFHVGRLSGTAGRVWQYTTIDLATSYVWAELATTPLNPSARRTSALARIGRESCRERVCQYV